MNCHKADSFYHLHKVHQLINWHSGARATKTEEEPGDQVVSRDEVGDDEVREEERDVVVPDVAADGDDG